MSFPAARNLRYGNTGKGWIYKQRHGHQRRLRPVVGWDPAPGQSSPCEPRTPGRTVARAFTRAVAGALTLPVAGTFAQPRRPFNASSPWNTPMSDARRCTEHGADQHLPHQLAGGEHLDINMNSWSVPMYWADSNTPKQPVYVSVGGLGWMGGPPLPACRSPTAPRPIPRVMRTVLVVDGTHHRVGLLLGDELQLRPQPGVAGRGAVADDGPERLGRAHPRAERQSR